MPKKGKKGGKKGKKKGKKKAKAPANSEDIMKRLLKCYERNCALVNSRMCPGIASGIRGCAENNAVLAKFILEPVTVEKEGDLPVLIDPLLTAIRQERYTFIKDVYIWGYPMTYENTASLALILEKPIYAVKQLEMMDCLLDAPSISRFSRVFQVSEVLTKINLDYNEFGDKGCKHLCNGLERNTTLLSLSLCYCDLGVKSGAYLGHILTTTALQDLFVDGNNLQCEGAMEIIKLCAEQAEYEATKRKRLEEEKFAAEEAIKTAVNCDESDEAKQNRLLPRPVSQAGSVKVSDDGLMAADTGGKKKKKKGKKKKKTKEPPAPPRVGPWVHKLHIADNAIDNLQFGAKFASVICMRLFKILIMHSDCVDEVDLEDNCIGDLAAREILVALEHRKEEKMGGVKLRTTHKLSSDVFNSIIKLGSGLTKKKKKGKKKKKK